jgi:hypothetical protein
MAHAVQEVADVLPAWLQSGSVSAQLAAAGYTTQRVMELLQATVQAGQDAVQAGPAAAATAAAAAAAAAVPPELLQELGLALSNLPIGTACNNPHCCSLAGLSEQQLVGGGGTSTPVCWLSCGTLLLQGLSGGSLEAAQASLQGCCQRKRSPFC